MTRKPRKLWQELRRRHVVRVAIAYLIVAAAVGGGASDFLPGLGAPDWVLRVALGVLVLGFPVALVLAWAYEVTPAGIRREDSDEPEAVDVEGGTSSDAGTAPPPDSEADAGTGGDRLAFDSKAVAVLPFANMSDDAKNEFFADGVTEDILMRLACIPDLHVVSRTSVMQYKGTTKSIGQISDELRVGSVLEGSVRRAGDQVRVVAQLIESATDRHLWAETYDRELADVFAVQADVAEHIASALEAQLAPRDLARVRRMPTANLDAYDLAVRGRTLMIRLRSQDIAQGRRLLEQAVREDPDYVDALVWLALSDMAEAYYGHGRPIEALERGRDRAEAARSIDPDSGLPWTLRGMARSHLWDWAGGREDMVRARELDPGVTDVRLFHGHHLFLTDRFEEAIGEFVAASELAPVEPLPHMFLSLALHRAGRADEAYDVIRRAIEMDPQFFESSMVYGWFLALDERFEEAIRASGRGADLGDRHSWPLGWHAVIQQAAGNEEGAVRLAEELRSPGKGGLGDTFGALIEGRIDDALDAIEAAAEDRDPMVLWFARAPINVLVDDGFLNHPRYEALNRRIWGESTPS